MTGGASGNPSVDEVLRSGTLTVLGRIRSASNATFLCEAQLGESTVHCVYKPVAGEQPLWDFPDGTLAGRERAAYLVSASLGWNIVPHTIIREGPAGPGMLQLWVDQPSVDQPSVDQPSVDQARSEGPGSSTPSGLDLVDLCPAGSVPVGYISVLAAYDYSGRAVALVHADDRRLMRIAVFDLIINNADRKGGHIITAIDGQVHGVDHGVSLHVEDKLRTVLWGWAGKPIDDETLGAVAVLGRELGGQLGEELREHLTGVEIRALRTRVLELLDNPVMPVPDGRRPIPWPAF